jgi:DMSO/TMAO reductase YedYZ molybdopterin-dependent catalytic subunit
MKSRFVVIVCVGIVLYLLTSMIAPTIIAKIPQSVTPAIAPLVVVSGEVKHVLQLSKTSFAQLPHRQIETKNLNGIPVTYSGVPLLEVLHLAGVPLGNDQLKGKNLTRYILAEGSDGFRVVFSIAELDDSFTDRIVLLADRLNGKPLATAEGPLRLIVDEKRFSRWVKQVTQFKILQAGNG